MRILLGIYVFISQIFECPIMEIKILLGCITFTGIWLFIHFNLFRNCLHFP